MKNLFCLLAIVLMSVVGCGKKPAASTETVMPKTGVSVQDDPATAAPPPPPPGGALPEAPAATEPTSDIKDNLPTAPADSGLAPGAAHRQLTEALHRYVEAKNAMPQTFEQLVAAKYIDKLPPAPPGKKFAIDRRNLQVVLVDK